MGILTWNYILEFNLLVPNFSIKYPIRNWNAIKQLNQTYLIIDGKLTNNQTSKI